MIKIRQATLNDSETLAKLLAQLFEKESEFRPDVIKQTDGLCAILENEEIGTIFVLEKENTVCGMVSLLWSISTALGGRVAWLEDMVIDSASQAKGLGTLLLEHALAYAKNVGCQRITLLSDDDNTRAHRFYERLGFQSSSMKPFRLIF